MSNHAEFSKCLHTFRKPRFCVDCRLWELLGPLLSRNHSGCNFNTIWSKAGDVRGGRWWLRWWLFFQQDGATAHTARDSTDSVGVMFSGRVILRFGNIARSASSPNLSVPCHCLWGQLPGKLCTNKSGTPEELKEHIRDGIRATDKVYCMRLWLISAHDYRNVL